MSKVKQDIVNELHKPARKKFKRRHVILKGIDDLWQADLADFVLYGRDNKGYKYILVVIDCFSKYIWTRGVKDKSGKVVADAMQEILSQDRLPKNLQTDMGKEFYNRSFENVMKKFSINHYSTYTTMKASIVERVIRSLKEMLYKEFSLLGNYRWIEILPHITEQYNSRKHCTIKMAPCDVTKDMEDVLLNTIYSRIKMQGRRKFQLGDIVRISKQKTAFEKGYTPNWSTELFKIINTPITSPATYVLEDMEGNKIRGAFYTEELQNVKHQDAYLVEKILKKRGNKVFVKWLGFNKKHNSWIANNNIL